MTFTLNVTVFKRDPTV